MRLVLRLNGSHVRRWHVQLIDRLRAIRGLELSVELSGTDGFLHSGFEKLFWLESFIHGIPGEGPATILSPTVLAPYRAQAGAQRDLTLDLSGDPADVPGRLWQLTFDGLAGEGALLEALLAGRTPLVEIVEAGHVVAAGRLGTEYGGIVLASFVDILARVTTLIVAALSGGGCAQVPDLREDAPRASRNAGEGGGLAMAATRELAALLARRLYQLCCHTPHWRTGWRRLAGPDLFDLRRHPETGWRDLSDDGRRFYADPFPIVHDGKVMLFVEEYGHRSRKGIISAVAFDENGPVGQPECVLEQPGHLSYPFVFARDGEVWMIPESSSAGTVDLFRSTAFPGGWVKEATLIAGVEASDATLVEHGGSWWLFATVRDGGGAFSDALCLWHAPDFRGPWTPHALNPVLIDIASARPAGRIVNRNGALLRPVQDCRRVYGGALGIARVTRLDRDAYEQSVETIIEAGPLWPGRRLHTLNSAGGLEFIDGSAMAWRRFPGMAA